MGVDQFCMVILLSSIIFLAYYLGSQSKQKTEFLRGYHLGVQTVIESANKGAKTNG